MSGVAHTGAPRTSKGLATAVDVPLSASTAARVTAAEDFLLVPVFMPPRNRAAELRGFLLLFDATPAARAAAAGARAEAMRVKADIANRKYLRERERVRVVSVLP